MITPEDVSYVARLARLRLSEAEQERMTRELSAVLGYVEHMNELSLDGVEPTARVVDLVNVLREDAPRPSLPLEVALSNAPDEADGGFGVPAAGS
ncbi:MAG: Asp-tRNA(Asn)/Glu-tRNA(Gln) amidotransferase subunit GatC [Thermoleophilaceae bacterium]|nr:Asp-tRNA(Asn)/Glu-tRNA(Gln) amidotransferase subunit GatC [Thermoleophilaceae bacterium]